MKSFKNFFKENVGTSDQNMAVDQGINPSEIQNPKVLKALNAYVGAIANMEYMLPEHALNKLKEKLGRLGFSFGAIPEMTEKSGSFDLPLTKFGGRFGKDLDTPADEFLNDDGISHMVEGGLALKIQYEMLGNSSCRIFAEIV
jgi:hypothetical protein|tara:strand:- start:306 stop:734 length:429 start_codon:yes stop_codon:yes gene_type:complete